MHLGVDLAAQDLLRAGDSQMGDLVAQGFLGTLRGGTGFVLGGLAGGGDDAAGFGAGLVDQLARLLFSGGPHITRGFAGLAQFLDDLLLGECQIGLGLVRSCQPVCDLVRTLVQCLHDGRPHEFHREPRQNEEHNELGYQGCVQIHGSWPSGWFKKG